MEPTKTNMKILQSQIDNMQRALTEMGVTLFKFKMTIEADYHLLEMLCERLGINANDFIKEHGRDEEITFDDLESHRKEIARRDYLKPPKGRIKKTNKKFPAKPTYLKDFGIDEKPKH